MSLTVVRAVGLVTIQDRGRPGHMHEALPPGGALVPELLHTANRFTHNPDETAAIEVLGQLVVRADRDVLVGTDRAHQLRAGEELTIASGARRVAYLAVRGGIDAPVILGGRGAHLSAGIGALIRAGERITPSDAPAIHAAPAPFTDRRSIRIVPGPDLDAFAASALDVLCDQPYRVEPTSDRVGTRLSGVRIARTADHVARTRPMVIGAIEVPPDGLPIVLGPEHPTTGGYPVLAVIAHADLGAMFAVSLGGSVQFMR